MEKPFLDLFDAIWIKATQDDLNSQENRLYADLKREFCTSQYIDADVMATERKYLKVIDEEMRTNKKEIQKMIKNKVYREAQEWPGIKRGKKDPVYEQEYRSLRKALIEVIKEKIVFL